MFSAIVLGVSFPVQCKKKLTFSLLTANVFAFVASAGRDQFEHKCSPIMACAVLYLLSRNFFNN